MWNTDAGQQLSWAGTLRSVSSAPRAQPAWSNVGPRGKKEGDRAPKHGQGLPWLSEGSQGAPRPSQLDTGVRASLISESSWFPSLLDGV